MKIYRVLVLVTLLITSSCTAILVRTTGEQGMQEDPSERTAGAVIEDQAIETKIIVNIHSFPTRRSSDLQTHFDVISHNGVVLLIGQVESEQLKILATEIASQASTKIKRIHNELEVTEKSSFMDRSSDVWIATKVRTLMLTDNQVPSSQVRVIAENGAVYLMGLISQADGDNAANVARNVSGVTKVVKVFEYIN